MSCVSGVTQCSGQSIIRSENGVALTSSSVQAYGKSTNDLATPIADRTTASGLTLASGGVAELRVAKAGTTGFVSAPALLLSSFEISWDGFVERPQIIETFNPTPGLVQMASDGTLTFGSLPDSTNLVYYDFATKAGAATQANYANNRYFTRDQAVNPSRCPPSITPCPVVETDGLHNLAGDLSTGGFKPDMTQANRGHEDGDIYAGDQGPGPAYFFDPRGTAGKSVPFPGTMGNRNLVNWGLQYGNLGAWLSKDTVKTVSWCPLPDEHKQNRRGVVAYGDVSDPAIVPTAGSATYTGFVYGWYYAPTATADAISFRGEALMTVNFITRAVVVTVTNTKGYDPVSGTDGPSVPVALTANMAMGAAGGNVANYLTGPLDDGKFKGGLSGRYFGPVVATGTSGAGPAELGGAFSLSNATTGEAVVGGFIGRKQ